MKEEYWTKSKFANIKQDIMSVKCDSVIVGNSILMINEIVIRSRITVPVKSDVRTEIISLNRSTAIKNICMTLLWNLNNGFGGIFY